MVVEIPMKEGNGVGGNKLQNGTLEKTVALMARQEEVKGGHLGCDI